VYDFRGSLFLLDANTAYDVEVTVTDSLPVFQTAVLTGSAVTRQVPPIGPTADVKYVSAGGRGGLYSTAQPGNLTTLILARLACGTTVVLKGGDYSLGDMQLNLTQDCSEDNPIVLMAAPGETPVLDGGSHDQYNWVEVSGYPDMYYAAIDPTLGFNSLCLL